MKCFHHPDVDAVGTCQACGRAICRPCSATTDGPLGCRGCVANAAAAPADAARTVLRRARTAGVVGGLLGAVLGFVAASQSSTGESPALAALGMGAGLAYFSWCGYWGVRVFWAGIGRALGALGILLWIPITWPLLCAFLALATSYGVLGGGAYQWFKHRSLAAGRSPAIAARNGVLGLVGGFVAFSAVLLLVVPPAIRWSERTSGQGGRRGRASARTPSSPTTDSRSPGETPRRPPDPRDSPSGQAGAAQEDQPSRRRVEEMLERGRAMFAGGEPAPVVRGAEGHLQAVTLEPSLAELLDPEYHVPDADYLDGWHGEELARARFRIECPCGDNPGGAAFELHPRAETDPETPFVVQWQHVNMMTVVTDGADQLRDWKSYESPWREAEHLGGMRWRVPDVFSDEDLPETERRRFPAYTLEELATELAAMGSFATARHVANLPDTRSRSLQVGPSLLRLRVAPPSTTFTTTSRDGEMTQHAERTWTALATWEFAFSGC